MLEIERARQSPEGRRALNKREKLARIEKAARALFARKGFEATTTREIAEKARIGIGTLFSYFPDKHDLLVHLFEHDITETSARGFSSIPRGATLVPALQHVFATFHDFYEPQPELARMYVSRSLFLDEKQRERLNQTNFASISEIADLARAAKQRGELRDDADPLAVAYHAFSLYFIGLVGWLSGTFPRAFHEAQLERALNEMMRGFGRADCAPPKKELHGSRR